MVFLLIIPLPPSLTLTDPLFPYSTLVRSPRHAPHGAVVRQGIQEQVEGGARNQRRRQAAARNGDNRIEPQVAPPRDVFGHDLLDAGIVVGKGGAGDGARKSKRLNSSH